MYRITHSMLFKLDGELFFPGEKCVRIVTPYATVYAVYGYHFQNVCVIERMKRQKRRNTISMFQLPLGIFCYVPQTNGIAFEMADAFIHWCQMKKHSRNWNDFDFGIVTFASLSDLISKWWDFDDICCKTNFIRTDGAQ